jgi:hypothetical protein
MPAKVIRSILAVAMLLSGLLASVSDGGFAIRLGDTAFAQEECSSASLARMPGRTSSAAPTRSESSQYQNWCRQVAARDTQPAAGGGGTLAAPGAGPEEVWCPPWSTQCYCWQGSHYNGCMNFAAHCTDKLTCGPAGHVCHCTSK